MLKAVLVFAITFALAAPLASATAWQWAFMLTLPFPAYDETLIYQQIKGRVLNWAWSLSALGGASLIGAAMLITEEYLVLVLIGSGVVLMVATWSLRAHRLFRVALHELLLPWPPTPAQS